MKSLFLLLLSVAVAMFCGCGYSLVTRDSALSHGQSVAVKLFANRTYQPNIEGEFRRALVNELASKGQIPGDELSDFVISGEIVSLSKTTVAFSAADKAKLSSMAVEIQMQLSERKSGKTLWKGSEIIRQEYPANTDLSLQRNAADAAVASICAAAAQLLVARMNQSF